MPAKLSLIEKQAAVFASIICSLQEYFLLSILSTRKPVEHYTLLFPTLGGILGPNELRRALPLLVGFTGAITK